MCSLGHGAMGLFRPFSYLGCKENVAQGTSTNRRVSPSQACQVAWRDETLSAKQNSTLTAWYNRGVEKHGIGCIVRSLFQGRETADDGGGGLLAAGAQGG